jgi:hypothetical protein
MTDARAANAQSLAVAEPLDPQLAIKAATRAAAKLRDTIRTRPNKRHVRVETTVDGNGEFVYTLVCSVDPSTGVAVLLSEVDGYPVRVEPWPL